MWALIAALVFAACGARAQFTQFSAPTSGTKLYFSSNLPLQGSNEPAQGRIFSVDGSGVYTVADVPATAPTPFTSYYMLSTPEASRDGSILIYTGARDCLGSSMCESSASFQTILQTTITGLPSGMTTAPGSGRISGSGRYVFLATYGPEVSTSLLDLQAGQTQKLQGIVAPDGLGRVVADDGTAVYDEGDELVIVAKDATSKSISLAAVYAQQAVIDSAAQVVVYVQWDYAANHRSLHAYSLVQQKDLTLFSQGNSTAPFVSADGTRAMFISTASGSPQMWTINTDGTGARQITLDVNGVVSAAMSDDGTTGWYLSNSGRVVQVDLNSGNTQERIGRTPYWYTSTPSPTPGSAWTLEGAGFSEETYTAGSYPLPTMLGGVTVTIGGINAPIFSVSPTQILVQLPWEIVGANFPPTSNAVAVAINTAYTSPFVAQLSTTVSPWSGFGVFIHDAADPYVLALHQDWSAAITPLNPARPNEIVHFYGLDFGPVVSHAPDGMPASANPLPRTVAAITCWAWAADNSTKLTIPVLYSGLAPGVAGYYQLDVQLPAANLRADTQVSCTGSGYDDGFYGDIPVKQ